MAKGADLHSHLSGAGYPEWWHDAAVQHGYTIKDKATWLVKMTDRINLRPLFLIPTIQAEIVYKNMLAYAEENVSYVEFIVPANKKLLRTLHKRLEKKD